MKLSLIFWIKKLVLIYRLGFKRMSFKKYFLAIRYMFNTIFLGKDYPGAIIVGLSYKCQCKCVHCSVGAYPMIPKKEMSVDQIKGLFDAIVKAGIPKVNIFGGEPLLLKTQVVELVRYGCNKGLSISIDTNGIMLTECLLKELKKAGINNINVSIDSADKQQHDELRGFHGAFDKAVKALELCVKEKIPCILSTYASKRAIHSGDLRNIIKMGKELKVTAVKILFPLMAGRWSNNTTELLSKDEKQHVHNSLEPGFVYLESPLFSMRNGKKICEALNKKMLYISPYGDVQACYAIPLSFGNIKNESLMTLINKMWNNSLFNSISNNYDCAMNNPIFRKNYSNIIDNSNEWPVCL